MSNSDKDKLNDSIEKNKTNSIRTKKSDSKHDPNESNENDKLILDENSLSIERKNKKLLKNQFSIKSSQDHPDVYIELEELHYNENELFFNSSNDEISNYEWKISSRWIKYEQNIDQETKIWSKPFVGAIIHQNLVYLKNNLQYGTIILNSQQDTFESITDEIIQDFISRGHMNRDFKEKLKGILLSQHRDHLSLAGAMTGKKAPISELFSSNWKHKASNHSFADNYGSSILRRNSFHNNHHLKHNQSGKNVENIDLSDGNIDDKNKPVKFFIPSSSIDTNSHENEHHHHHHHRHFKSTINLFRNSLMHHSKSKNTDLGSLGEVEAFVIMVGTVDFLDRPVMAFVRLNQDQFIDHLIEFQVKVRFLFIFLGPKKNNIDYYEVGRCMGNLMSTREFNDCAYSAKNRQEILRGINSFMNRNLCILLPVGDYDDDLMQPVLEWMKTKMNKKLRSIHRNRINDRNEKETKLNHELVLKIDKNDNQRKNSIEKTFDPFKRTGKLFGSLINEINHRYKNYFSDIRDGFNLHCLIATVFIFTVCVTPALCFGGILADKTKQWFGVNEMLLATSINGIIFGLFSGQPLMIFGATGPFLVFEEMLYNFCTTVFCIEFLATRFWVSFWVLIFTLIMLGTELVFIIHYVTRFTEEIFAFLIACVFLTDAIKKIFYYFNQNPIYKRQVYCQAYQNLNNTSSLQYNYYTINNNYTNSNSNQTLNFFGCSKPDYYVKSEYKSKPEPNIALISLILLLGTCAIALLLKKLRRSKFFGSYMRRTLSDVGILISIILMMGVDLFIRNRTDINTQKLDIPDELSPTRPRNWFVSPFGNNYVENQSLPLWVPLASIFPAFLIFIVLFFEIELTGIILNAKHRKLKKGTGFNLDLFLGALMMTLNSLFGLPWMCSAPVRTLAHWASLSVYSTSIIPGEKARLINVKEQRVTSILVHIAIGLCLKGKFILKLIPVPVLFGIFLYFGIVSISGTQLYDRIKFAFIPFKYCPNLPYAIGIRPSKRNLFTLLQLIGVIFLLVIKSLVNVSYLFPIVLVLLVPFRKFILPKFFTHRELELLDEENESQEDDIVHDFYELTHLPI